jgi:hypothetical protein
MSAQLYSLPGNTVLGKLCQVMISAINKKRRMSHRISEQKIFWTLGKKVTLDGENSLNIFPVGKGECASVFRSSSNYSNRR